MQLAWKHVSTKYRGSKATLNRCPSKKGAYLLGMMMLIFLLASSVVWADYEAGDLEYKRGNYSAAYRIWKPLAENGDAKAQWGLGFLYLQLQLPPEEMSKETSRLLGQAVYWLTKSADQHFPDALTMLGQLYVRGFGVKRDVSKAMQLYEQAAATGDALAEYNLAAAYTEGKNGIKINFQRAAALLFSAAGKGLRIAHFNLGVMYAKGVGVTKDIVRSYMHFGLVASIDDKHGLIGSIANLNQRSAQARKNLEATMTSGQIAEAQRLTVDWLAKHRQ